MKVRGFLCVAGALALLIQTNSQAQVTIADWTFETNAIAINNSPSPTIGSGTASALGMGIYPTPSTGANADDVLLGKSNDTGANGVADLTQTWRVRAQGGSGTLAANGWSSAAPIGSQGAQFAVSTLGFTNVTVSFDWYATTQGEANMQLEYTTDSVTWNNVKLTLSGSDGGLVLSNNTTSANTVNGWFVSDSTANGATGAGQDWFTGLTATITDPAAADDANFAIRIVNASTGADDVSTQGTALNNSSGNWRFDNVEITGLAEVPEPSTWMLVGMGLSGVLLVGRRVRRG
ncbi:MAG TPA: PEP-CTERM sorting domain-containing protein [Verrucomicrobiae bacterium]|nr:PEP-CTERM sorting domain-containing protein [Verrucomicrobiae bacterium]